MPSSIDPSSLTPPSPLFAYLIRLLLNLRNISALLCTGQQKTSRMTVTSFVQQICVVSLLFSLIPTCFPTSITRSESPAIPHFPFTPISYSKFDYFAQNRCCSTSLLSSFNPQVLFYRLCQRSNVQFSIPHSPTPCFFYLRLLSARLLASVFTAVSICTSLLLMARILASSYFSYLFYCQKFYKS